MTSKEALEGFQTLSRKFGKAYKGDELNRVWPELLKCSHSAFVRAVGIITKSSKRLPDPEYVLAQSRQWEEKMARPCAVASEKKATPEPEDEGRLALRNLVSWMEKEIDVDEYIRRLFAMSETYGKPGYAQEAMRLGKKHKEEANV